MLIKQRVEEFIKYKKISMRKFESACGVSNGYFSSLKNAIGNDKMKAITLQFPDLNPVWLQMGEGKMIREQYEKIDESPSQLKEPEINPHFENRSIDALSRALDRITQLYSDVIAENDSLKEEIENLRKVVSAQKAGA